MIVLLSHVDYPDQCFGKLYKLVLCLLLLSSLLPMSYLAAQSDFPVPPQLAKNVEFWIKVYSQYSSNHVIIHDKNDVSIIYRVVKLNDYFDEQVDFNTKWEKVEEIKDEYRKILDKLAHLQVRGSIQLDSLTAEERHVFILWSQCEDPDKFKKARYGVRGQLGLRDRFEESLKRSGAYHDYIVETMARHQLPIDLAYLPHVESLFDYNSHSKVGAVGLWQFIRHTGRLFMTINSAIDERRDPIAATEAAAKLLKLNYEELQSWPLAITAYNHGLTGMKNAILETGSRDFGEIFARYTSRTFAFASRNFYAEFLAARQVAKNYKAYFGDIGFRKPISYQTIVLPNSAYLWHVAAIFDVPEDTLIACNPAFRWPVVHNKRPIPKGYELRLPYRDGYDPREVFVRNTKPAPQQKVQNIAAISFAFQSSTADTVNMATETEILNILKKPLPPLINRSGSIKMDEPEDGM